MDLLGVKKPHESLEQQNQAKKLMHYRKFTTWALSNCDLLTLSVSDLDKMRIEFPDVYNELHADAKTHYKF